MDCLSATAPRFCPLLSVSNLSSGRYPLSSYVLLYRLVSNLCLLITAKPFPPHTFVCFFGTMAQTDFCEFSHTLRYGLLLWRVHASCRERTSQTSPGKNDDLPFVQPPHLLQSIRVALDFFLFSRVVRTLQPLMRFLFVGPKFCPLEVLPSAIRLPPDSTSRWTPLPSASGSCYQARSGLSPPSHRPCRAH